MEKNGKSGAGMNSFMNVAALISVVGLIGLAVWHTTQYMELIFRESGGGPGDWSRDLGAAFVEAAIIGSLILVVYRGTGQGDDDDPDEKKVPSAAGSESN